MSVGIKNHELKVGLTLYFLIISINYFQYQSGINILMIL